MTAVCMTQMDDSTGGVLLAHSRKEGGGREGEQQFIFKYALLTVCMRNPLKVFLSLRDEVFLISSQLQRLIKVGGFQGIWRQTKKHEGTERTCFENIMWHCWCLVKGWEPSPCLKRAAETYGFDSSETVLSSSLLEKLDSQLFLPSSRYSFKGCSN